MGPSSKQNGLGHENYFLSFSKWKLAVEEQKYDMERALDVILKLITLSFIAEFYVKRICLKQVSLYVYNF